MKETIPIQQSETHPSSLSHSENITFIDYGRVPRPESRYSSEQARHTAGHELNHALIAIDHGIMPFSLSVIPEGNSLGRTIFSGDIDTETFKIIAAGGSVDTPFGRASGFGSSYQPGSDLFHIASLHEKYGGINAEEAKKRAQQSLSTIPEKIREKASEIIASLGNISGDEIPNIIRIAEFEIHYGASSVASSVEESISGLKESESYQKQSSSGRKTILGIDEDGNIQKPVIVSGENSVCVRCGGKNIHLPLCILSESENVSKKRKTFPSSEVIFDLTKDVPRVA